MSRQFYGCGEIHTAHTIRQTDVFGEVDPFCPCGGVGVGVVDADAGAGQERGAGGFETCGAGFESVLIHACVWGGKRRRGEVCAVESGFAGAGGAAE